MTAYYSEFDPKAAAWLRELIKQGHIADGEVDERDLWDVSPDDLRGFDQVHLCAGIGVWSYALRRAGWPDDRPVWTGSFPCQPFSSAGKGAGFADERHLWPAGRWLTEQCRPRVFFGEQVASKDAEPWLDLVQADLEALGYAVGAEPFPSAGVGAPHIRDRLYWVADANRWQRDGLSELRGTERDGADAGWSEGRGEPWPRCDNGSLADVMPAGRTQGRPLSGSGPFASSSSDSGLADDDDAGLEGRRQPGRERAAERPAGAGGVAGGLGHPSSAGARRDAGTASGAEGSGSGAWLTDGHDGSDAPVAASSVRGLADTAGARHEQTRQHECGPSQLPARSAEHGRVDGLVLAGTEDGAGAPRGHGTRDLASPAGPVNGLWRDADWLYCRDGIWRPVEPGTFPLAHGAPARVGRLRGYGNAINAEAATAFVEAYLDAEAERVRLTSLSEMTSPNVFD